MRCRRTIRWLPEFVDGALPARREAKIRAHLATCGSCSEIWERERLVSEALESWPDLPPPEDSLQRIETRIAFAPPAPVLLRTGAVRSLFLPYVAGLATAAALFLFLRPGASPVENGTRPGAGGAAPDSSVTASRVELLPSERKLQFVDDAGRLRELRWDPTTEEMLRRNLDEQQYEQLKRSIAPAPVDYEVR
jgi:anti-sigma factor RsiW